MNFAGDYKDVIQPHKIHTLSISVFLKDLQDTRGGVGANIAYTLALLGERPILLGSVGQDARSYMKDLKAMGVDVNHVHFSLLPTASFNVITDRMDNQVGGFYPGAMFDSKSLSFLPWVKQDMLAVISPHDPKAMRRQVKECRKSRMRYFYDVGQQVSNISGSDILEGVKGAQILIVNDYELGVLCQKTGLDEARLKSMVPVLVTTLGHKGSRIDGREIKKTIMVRAAKPKNSLDPTGAGDAYRAGFLFGYLRNLPLEICGNLGSVAAVYTVEKKGTQTHTFTLDAFKKRYKSNYNQELEV